MAALVRGQGKTEGFHERVIALPGEVALGFGTSGDDAEATTDWSTGATARKMGIGRKAPQSCFEAGVLVFPDDPRIRELQDARRLLRALSRFDPATMDAVVLRDRVEAGRGWESAENAWQGFLKQSATALAEEAWESLSPPAARREKARVAAERVLSGGLRKNLPNAFSETETKEH